MASRRPPRLSQNFLVDRAIAARIVAAFDPQTQDEVVEVGPGRGALTSLVAGRVARLIAIELDRGLASGLREHHRRNPAFELIEQDVLRVDLRELVRERPLRLLANLPYHISSPFILKLLDEGTALSDAVVMLQAEFADRLSARESTSSYGSLSVLVQARFAVSALLTVPPRAFEPRPEVTSRVLRLTPRAEPLVSAASWASLKILLRAAFSGRRKTLANALARGLHRSRDEVAAWLSENGIDPGARPETLSPRAWAGLAQSAPGQRYASDILDI